MMGCLKKLGCLFVVLVLVIVAWFTRGLWLPSVRWGGTRNVGPAGATAQTWQPLTTEGADRAKAALQQLRSQNGPESASVAPGDLAAYIFQELSRTLPTSADSIEAAAIADRLYVRAVIPTKDLGDKGTLGPFALLLGDRERVQMGGTLRIIRPGLAELQVKEMRIRDFNLPQGFIPKLIRQMSRGERPPELSPDGLPLRTPEFIGDVRVLNGQITMYKTVQSR